MGFHNVRLDTAISFGYRGGPGFVTIIQETATGHEERIQHGTQARHRYRANKELLTDQQTQDLIQFYIGRRGALYGFRFKDWHDYTTAVDGKSAPSNTDVVLGSGDGTQTAWQLYKPYDSSGSLPYARTITLPVAATVVCALDGTPTSAFTFSTTTGVVTFTSPPGMGVQVTAGFEFDVPVRFAASTDNLLEVTAFAHTVSSVLDIELVEILDEVEFPETWDPGGVSLHATMTMDVELSPSTARTYYVDPSSGLYLILPNPSYIGSGHIFTVLVDGTAAGSVTVLNDTGTTVGGPYVAGARKDIFLVVIAGTATWLIA